MLVCHPEPKAKDLVVAGMKKGVILDGACLELKDEILRGACPEPKDEILRFAQNDKTKGSE